MDIAYEKIYLGEGGYEIYPINPTGRWKIEHGPYGRNKLFIEHRWGVFKSWIHEENITFLPAKEVHIFDCKEGI